MNSWGFFSSAVFFSLTELVALICSQDAIAEEVENKALESVKCATFFTC